MDVRFYTAEEIEAALPMRAAIESQKRALSAMARGSVDAPPRATLRIPEADGTTLVMPGYVPGVGLGAKLVSVFPGNALLGVPTIQGVVVLLDVETGAPRALLDGTFLTAWRTGAVSGAATDLCARSDSRVGAVIGCGAQGRTQAIAIDTARDLDEIRAYDRTPAAVERFVREVGPRLACRLAPAASAAEAVAGADVVCTATPATEPVLPDGALAPGVHVNAVGAFTPDMREIEDATIGRARVFVDLARAALDEAGELLHARAAGATRAEDWTELGRVVSGDAEGRRSDDEITLFKSVGHAAQDISAAAAVLEAEWE